MKKIMITTIILTITISLFINNVIYAQTNQEDINKVLINIENERIKKLEAQLALIIPLTTDNPNHVITFADQAKKGVKLEIDGQGYRTVKSPYSLPSLGIGKHTLTFKFTDTEGTEQTLEKSITVIPRPPILQVPETVNSTKISIKGTALASSTVNIFLSSGTKSYRESVTVDTNGAWTKEITGEFSYGIYTTIAYTTKNGIASQYSEPLVFEYKSDNNNINIDTKQKIYFTFKDSIDKNIIETLKSNTDLIILILSSILLGLTISSLLTFIINRKKNQKLENIFQNFLDKKTNIDKDKNINKETKEEKPLTIREKIAMLQKEKVQEQTLAQDVNQQIIQEVDKDTIMREQDEKNLNKKANQVVLSKEKFLSDFKNFDPDNNQGEEIKKNKKDVLNKVKISLTSNDEKK